MEERNLDSVSSGLNYDFMAARHRQQAYIGMYRKLKRAGAIKPELEFELMALIDEIEREIAEAHQAVNGKMTTVQGGHSVMHIGNILNPIISQWRNHGEAKYEIN
jgi:hypothetical protein